MTKSHYLYTTSYHFHPQNCSHQHRLMYSVSRKRDQNFFVISSIKLRRFWWNLVHRFPNKFASKWCNCFPPPLNNVSTLPCKTWNAHRTRATLELLQKETPQFIPPQPRLLHSPDLDPVDYSVWCLLQEKKYMKNSVTDLQNWNSN